MATDFDPTARTTKLEAVNAVLVLLGKDPVDAIPMHGTDQLTDAIENIIDATTRETLGRGWHFNTVTRTLTAAAGEVTLDTDMLEFDVGKAEYAQKGTKLWNKTTGLTTGFSGDYAGVAIIALDFEDCPQVFREYVVSKAAETMAYTYSAETEFLSRLEFRTVKAYRNLLSAEGRTRNTGLLSNSGIYRTVGYRHH